MFALLPILALAASTPAQPTEQTVAAPVADTSNQPRLVYVYAGPDGESHAREIEVSPSAGVLPLTGLRAVSYKPAKVQWHNAPSPQFAINLTGTLEVETSDGARRRIGPGDLVFMSDTTGKGHVTRLLSPVTALFIQPAPGFDVQAWAAGGK